MEIFNALVSNDGTTDKAEDDSIVQKSFFERIFFSGLEKGIDILGTASEVSDAHGCGDTISVNFPEAFYLDTTGKRGKAVCEQIVALWEEAYDSKNNCFYNNGNLPPV